MLAYQVIGIVVILVRLEEDAGDALELHLGTAHETLHETATSHRAMTSDRTGTTVGEEDNTTARLEFQCQRTVFATYDVCADPQSRRLFHIKSEGHATNA